MDAFDKLKACLVRIIVVYDDWMLDNTLDGLDIGQGDAGILLGHFGEAVDHGTLDFVKEFGLILFVFTIGLQLGPGFFATFRQQGVKMNALAAAIVVLGAVGAPPIPDQQWQWGLRQPICEGLDQ